jgi:hypothetical protein
MLDIVLWMSVGTEDVTIKVYYRMDTFSSINVIDWSVVQNRRGSKQSITEYIAGQGMKSICQ